MKGYRHSAKIGSPTLKEGPQWSHRYNVWETLRKTLDFYGGCRGQFKVLNFPCKVYCPLNPPPPLQVQNTCAWVSQLC